MNETIYILLPVHNRREITRRFIDCLNMQTYGRYHLVLIDDGSTDGTAAMVQEHMKSQTVITGDGSWWWGGSLHQGYKWLRNLNPPHSDVVLIVNDDTEFADDFLEKGLAVLREHSHTFLLAKCYDRSTNALVDAGVHVDWKRFIFEKPSAEKPVNCLSTRGLFFRVGDFFTAGGFHPRLLPHYLSDYEFTIRAHRKGIHLMTHPSVTVRLDASTTGWHRYEDGSLISAVRSVFMMKSAINPLMLLMFLALACPWRWKFKAGLRVAGKSLSRAWMLLVNRTESIKGKL
jgi:GT2 family glycosyltransferase